jgi:hypothetical protein
MNPNNPQSQPSEELEVVGPSALESITRGEIDVQIRTAHQFPRSMAQFKKRALDMALIDEETAESCIYVRPVGMKDGKQQFAEGLSIRMAEIVAASYGNIRVGSMIIEQTERSVKCRGVAHDLESNFASTSECIEPTIKRDGKPMSEGMRNVIAKACLAKAWRDALFKVVPRALCKPIETETRKLAAGNAQSLAAKRANVQEWINRLGIEPVRVFTALGIKGIDDVTSEMLVMLAGLKTSIKDGEVKIDEAFPEIIPTGSVGAAKTGEGKPGDAAKPESAANSTAGTGTAGPTPTEAAAQEGATAKKPEPTKEPAGPSAAELRKGILAKLATAGVGKVGLVKHLIAANRLPADTKFDDLDRDALAGIADSIDDDLAEIKK